MIGSWKPKEFILADALGDNDNTKSQDGGKVVFNAPVTIHSLHIWGRTHADEQCKILADRISGFLAAQGTGVVAAFEEGLAKRYEGKCLKQLSADELTDVLVHFERMLREAKLLAAILDR